MTDEGRQGNGAADTKTGGSRQGDAAPKPGVTNVDHFGFLSESDLATDSDHGARSPAAKASLGPLREPDADDVFPSEVPEPPSSPLGNTRGPVSGADLPAESQRDRFPVESPHDRSSVRVPDERAHHHAGRLVLALSACALAAAAFVVTQQALTRARLAAPAGIAVPARVPEEPPSSPNPAPEAPASPPTADLAPSAAPLDGTAGMLPTGEPVRTRMPQADPAAAPPVDGAGSRLLTGARREPSAALLRGSLAVSSSPPGAQVFVNGVAVGVTPLVLDSVPIGSRVVRIELEGHERWSSVVRIVANEQTMAAASLRRLSVP